MQKDTLKLNSNILAWLLVAFISGIIWGILNQFLPSLLDWLPNSNLYRDPLISLLWVLLLVTLLVFSPSRQLFYAALLGAIFWTSATVAYYVYYIVRLAQQGPPGTNWPELPDGGLSFLWSFAKHTLVKWLLISAVGGAVTGTLGGLLRNVLRYKTSESVAHKPDS